jgi:LuxR family transcriptional regulator, maltose regulon positive regulatory protein
VPRPRLSERLSRGAESALTLVSAPAGFGKTTLLADWLAAPAANGRSAAWLSLDQRDNDPSVFWTYLVAALETAVPGTDAGAISLLQSPQPPIEAVVATLLNDLSAISNDVVLVLDDYHVIHAREVQDGMAFLLERLPQQIHLVIAGRAGPRAATSAVASTRRARRDPRRRSALHARRGCGIPQRSDGAGADGTGCRNAGGRTEGWIAALQLAALSMQGRDDVAGFIAGFAGDDRYIVDYLAEEVLQRQPEHVRHFLLRTSILDRLSGPLCDAVTGHDGGKAKLAALEQGNLFLVPLDDRRQWYR